MKRVYGNNKGYIASTLMKTYAPVVPSFDYTFKSTVWSSGLLFSKLADQGDRVSENVARSIAQNGFIIIDTGNLSAALEQVRVHKPVHLRVDKGITESSERVLKPMASVMPLLSVKILEFCSLKIIPSLDWCAYMFPNVERLYIQSMLVMASINSLPFAKLQILSIARAHETVVWSIDRMEAPMLHDVSIYVVEEPATLLTGRDLVSRTNLNLRMAPQWKKLRIDSRIAVDLSYYLKESDDDKKSTKNFKLEVFHVYQQVTTPTRDVNTLEMFLDVVNKLKPMDVILPDLLGLEAKFLKQLSYKPNALGLTNPKNTVLLLDYVDSIMGPSMSSDQQPYKGLFLRESGEENFWREGCILTFSPYMPSGSNIILSLVGINDRSEKVMDGYVKDLPPHLQERGKEFLQQMFTYSTNGFTDSDWTNWNRSKCKPEQGPELDNDNVALMGDMARQYLVRNDLEPEGEIKSSERSNKYIFLANHSLFRLERSLCWAFEFIMIQNVPKMEPIISSSGSNVNKFLPAAARGVHPQSIIIGDNRIVIHFSSSRTQTIYDILRHWQLMRKNVDKINCFQYGKVRYFDFPDLEKALLKGTPTVEVFYGVKPLIIAKEN